MARQSLPPTNWAMPLGRRFYATQVGIWLVFAVGSYASYYYAVAEEYRIGMLRWDVVRLVTGILITSGIAHCIVRTLERGARPKRVVVLSLVSSVPLAGGWLLLLFAIGRMVGRGRRMPDRYIAPWLVEHSMILLAWTACFLAIVLWRRSIALERETFAIRDRAQRAKLEALSHQLRPHFLFNSLNSLRSLIDADNERAREMVTRLSEFLRYTVQSGPGDMVSLGEEIEALERYLDVERERFEDSLDFALDVSADAARTRVPELLLLPLVENAVTHGLTHTREDIEILLDARVSDDRLQIRVSNRGTLDPVSSNGAGTGLENVRRRLELHYPGDHRLSIDEEGDRVTAHLDLPVQTA